MSCSFAFQLKVSSQKFSSAQCLEEVFVLFRNVTLFLPNEVYSRCTAEGLVPKTCKVLKTATVACEIQSDSA